MTTISATTTTTYDQRVADRDRTARALYRAELAVHDARQSQVDAWLQAASARLHDAIVAHLEAEARLHEGCAA